MSRWLIPAVVVVAGLAFVQLWRTHSPATGPTYVGGGASASPATLPGMRTGPAPWGPGTRELRERLLADGLPPSDGGALHIHAHLDLFVDGRRVTVPSQVGIDAHAGLLAPLHTHDDSGLVHVESPVVRTFTLGQFFDVWAVRFTSTCLGSYCDGGGRTLRVFVDGTQATGDVRDLALFSHEEIVVAFGTPAQLPKPVPNGYGFHLFE